MTKRARWWWLGGLAVVALAGLTSVTIPNTGPADVLFIFALLWGLASAVLVAWRVWRWMTYRVGIRLLLSYLLVGVLPVLFAAAFSAIGLYIMMGQYTSVRVGSQFERFYWVLGSAGSSVLTAARAEGVEAAVADLERIHADPPKPLTRALWRARLGDRSIALTDDEIQPDFEWLPEGQSWWVGLYENRVYSVAANRAASGDWVAALVPFDDVTAFDLSNEWWFDIAFVDEGFGNGGEPEPEPEAPEAAEANESTTLQMDGQGSVRLTVGDDTVTGDELWPEWTDSDGKLLSRPIVIWFRMVSDMVQLDTGEPLGDFRSFALLRTSPKNVWDDFTLSKYEIRKEILGAVLGLGVFFLIGYGLALAAAAAVIYSIARSTSRLTKGAREVERGNLDYRVPVKRKDQLGDLAVSFNSMTDSVQSMLSDVAEKERLAKELELARQIQESLLPAADLDAGPLVVRAVFEPAAEVGGDYFDIFTPSDDTMVVAIGDVAGHGLPAGLLMASLKSTVATLIHEDYSGGDLIARVNSLIADNRQGRTLVTLAVLEIDLVADVVRLANAGHPPPLLIAPDGTVDELMAGSLPIGSRLSHPSTLERPLPPGGRILLYSDGLVEAVSKDDEPFGYDRLNELVAASALSSGAEIVEQVRHALADHVGEVPLADDLTLLVIERRTRCA